MDIDLFISEIENHPAIWDRRSDLYSNRLEKTKAWEEICINFIPDFQNKSVQGKNTAAAQLQRKWKSLRDSFNRERVKQKSIKSGSEASSRKEYIYFQQLSFLSVLAETRPASQDVEQEQDPSTPATPVARTDNRKKRKIMSSVEKTELELLNNISKKMNYQAEEDSDRNFLLSILPDFKTIHEVYKLDFKTELLVLLKKYKNLQNQQSFYQNQPQYGYYTQPPTIPQVPSREYTNLTPISAPGTLREYSIQRLLSAPGPSHDCNSSNTSVSVPVPTPSPDLSNSVHSLSDSSIIEDMFYDNQ